MRNIKFRGKTSCGEWLYGYPIVMPDGECGIFKIGDFEQGAVDVIPETVGQFTGLRDMRGVEIYEGDIMRSYNYRIFEVKYGMKELYQVVWEEYYTTFNLYFISQGKPFDTYKISREINLYTNPGVTHEGTADIMEVIGNIHDNPELLNP